MQEQQPPYHHDEDDVLLLQRGGGSSSSSLFDIVPMDILSNHILGEYSTGRTISTFAIVVEGYYYNNNSNNRKRTTKDRIKNNPPRQPYSQFRNRNNKDNDNTIEYYTSTNIIRDTLVTRYDTIASIIRTKRQQFFKNNSYYNNNSSTTNYETSEVEDVLEYIRYTISSKLNDIIATNDPSSNSTNTNNDRSIIQNNNNYNVFDRFDTIKERMKLISEWCSIIDYFELLPLQDDSTSSSSSSTDHNYCSSSNDKNNDTTTTTASSSLIVWVGPIDTSFGRIEKAILSCTTTDSYCTEPYGIWSPSALLYWYEDYELYEYTLVTPYTSAYINKKVLVPYGTLSVPWESAFYATRDCKVVEHITYSLNPMNDPRGRFTLVPRHFGYEQSIPPICFVAGTTTRNYDDGTTYPKLLLYWDITSVTNTNSTTTNDWEETIELLPSYVIRIMNRLQHLQPNPYRHAYCCYDTYSSSSSSSSTSDDDDDDTNNDDEDII